MTNPLASLDELIWKQFEKVTQYAQKSYGWDKYDCKQVTDSLSGIAALGFGIYSMLTYNINEDFMCIPAGALFSVSGISLHYLWKKENEDNRKQEIKKVINSGVLEYPSFMWVRPLAIAAGIGILGKGIHLLEPNDVEKRVMGLMTISAVAYCEFLLASNYFSSQIMTPPSTKKPFWKTTYEMMKNKFKPRPQLEPAAAPTPQYVTIDTLMT